MKCIKCGRPVGVGRYCNACGFDNKHIAKALNTADYYYNIGLEKAQMHDLSGAEMYLKKALIISLIRMQEIFSVLFIMRWVKAARHISNGKSVRSFLP